MDKMKFHLKAWNWFFGIGLERPKDKLPPQLSGYQWGLRLILDGMLFGGLLYLGWICSKLLMNPKFTPDCNCWIYIALGFILLGFIGGRYYRYQQHAHSKKTVDRSETESILIEAKNVNIEVRGPEKINELTLKKKQIDEEIQRLREIGPKAWTDYQLLNLNQMVVDFLPIEDLKSRAYSILDSLDEYSQDSSYRYDYALFTTWKDRIDSAIKRIDKLMETNEDDKIGIDNAANQLRAEQKTLFEHLSEYKSKWAEGSSMVQELNYSGILSFFVFFTIGLVPLILDFKSASFNIYHWGFFGMAGAVASTLRAFYRSDLLEIGNTEGSRELIRAFLGASMGFFSGAIAYLVIAGGIVGSSAVIPNIPVTTLKDWSLSAFWAMASGFSFDKILDRFRTSVDGKIS